MSAIDGLIAALVAAPSFVRPEELPLIFGGRQPLHENSPELHAVKTIFNRYNEVSETLADSVSTVGGLDRSRRARRGYWRVLLARRRLTGCRRALAAR